MKCGACGASQRPCRVCGVKVWSHRNRPTCGMRCRIIRNTLNSYIGPQGRNRMYFRQGSKPHRAAVLAWKYRLPIFYELSDEVQTQIQSGRVIRSYHHVLWSRLPKSEPISIEPNDELPEDPAEWLASLGKT